MVNPTHPRTREDPMLHSDDELLNEIRGLTLADVTTLPATDTATAAAAEASTPTIGNPADLDRFAAQFSPQADFDPDDDPSRYHPKHLKGRRRRAGLLLAAVGLGTASAVAVPALATSDSSSHVELLDPHDLTTIKPGDTITLTDGTTTIEVTVNHTIRR